MKSKKMGFAIVFLVLFSQCLSAQEGSNDELREILKLNRQILSEIQSIKSELGKLKEDVAKLKTQPSRRVASAPAPRIAKRAATSTASREEKILSYSKSIMQRYDKDSDNSLSLEEAKKCRSLPGNADSDGDGVIQLHELFTAFGGKEFPADKESKKADGGKPTDDKSEAASLESKIRAYAKSAIKKYDKNGDGKLSDDERKGITGIPDKSDGDQDGLLSLEEFVNGLREQVKRDQASRKSK